jgi:transcriptional regulator with XRE-family HTH domain
MKKKLSDISSGKASDWVQRAEETLKHAGAQRNAWKLALRVLDILEERGMSQTALAQKLGVSRQQVTRIVKGKENFTFQTVDRLEQALGETLMTIGEKVPVTVVDGATLEAPMGAGSMFTFVAEGEVDWVYCSQFFDQQIEGAFRLETFNVNDNVFFAPHQGSFAMTTLVQDRKQLFADVFSMYPGRAPKREVGAGQKDKEEYLSNTA